MKGDFTFVSNKYSPLKTNYMKKYLKLTLLTSIFGMKAFAQIPNAGFECINASNIVCNWGTGFVFTASLGNDGMLHTDSIVFDNMRFDLPSLDAHTGNQAIEISNAWNYTQNVALAGRILASTDSSFSSYATFVPITYNPQYFSFYYKYLPVGGDSAIASLKVYDTASNEIGAGTIIMSSAATNYTLAQTNVVYTSSDVAAFVVMSFRTAVNQINMGTRLLVDDVSFQNLLATQNLTKENSFSFYPNPAVDIITLNNTQNTKVEIVNELGSVVLQQNKAASIDISQLSKGFYYLKVYAGDKIEIKKFLKD
jgi:Secretion system C-terminal sorting domain